MDLVVGWRWSLDGLGCWMALVTTHWNRMALVTRHLHGIALVPETSISGGFLYIYINNDELEDDDDECGSGGATSSFLSFSARADSALTLACAAARAFCFDMAVI